jgi:hypothetical protein
MPNELIKLNFTKNNLIICSTSNLNLKQFIINALKLTVQLGWR